MNEMRPYSNESSLKDRLTETGLKELKVNIYTNKVSPHFRWLDYKNSKSHIG